MEATGDSIMLELVKLSTICGCMFHHGTLYSVVWYMLCVLDDVILLWIMYNLSKKSSSYMYSICRFLSHNYTLFNFASLEWSVSPYTLGTDITYNVHVHIHVQ